MAAIPAASPFSTARGDSSSSSIALARNFTEFNGLRLMAKLLGKYPEKRDSATLVAVNEAIKMHATKIYNSTFNCWPIGVLHTDARVLCLLVNTLQLPSTRLHKLPSKILPIRGIWGKLAI